MTRKKSMIAHEVSIKLHSADNIPRAPIKVVSKPKYKDITFNITDAIQHLEKLREQEGDIDISGLSINSNRTAVLVGDVWYDWCED